MINAKPRWQKDFINVLDRAITDGIAAPSFLQKIKINGLVARHVRSGFWATRDVYFNFRHDGPEAFNYYSYKNTSSFKITKTGSTTFTTNTKVLFGGGHYDTNYNLGLTTFPSLLSSIGISCGITDNSANFLFGSNASGVRYLWPIGNLVRINCETGLDVSPDTAIGTCKFVMRRISTTQVSFIRNGATDGVKSQAVSAAVNTQDIFLGVRNNNGTANGATGAGLSYWSCGINQSDGVAAQEYADETAFEASL